MSAFASSPISPGMVSSAWASKSPPETFTATSRSEEICRTLFIRIHLLSGHAAAQAAMKPASRPMSEAKRPAPSLSARWKMGEPTSTATRNSAAVKSTARWISTL